MRRSDILQRAAKWAAGHLNMRSKKRAHRRVMYTTLRADGTPKI
jgi:hypothetical protein